MKKERKALIMKRLVSLAFSLALLCACLTPAFASTGAPSEWAAEETPRAEQLGLVPKAVQGDWQQPITRGEFAVLAIRYLALEYGYTEDAAFVNDYMTLMPDRNGEFWGEEDFGDGLTWWERFADDEGHFYLTDLPQGEQRGYINSAYFIGIVNGKGDGSVYDPEGAITRQEAACMLARSYEILDPEDYRQALYSEYGDYGAMADWAKDDIATVVGLDVMGSTSVGAKVFEPLGTYSREQAVVTFLRLHENAPVSRSKENVAKLENAAYERAVWTSLYRLGQTESIVDFRADTAYGTVLALHYSGGMHFYETLQFIRRDGRTVTLSGKSAGSDWVVSTDERTFTYSVGEKQYQADLTTGQVTERN